MRNATEFYAQQVLTSLASNFDACKNSSSVEFYCKEIYKLQT